MNEVEKTVGNPSVMRRMRGIIINRYKIPAGDADGVLFEALTTANEWWDKDIEASWLTALFTALETTCKIYKRKHKHDYKYVPYEDEHAKPDCVDAERIVHFKQLLPKVMDCIHNVENDENRCILMCALVYGDPMHELSLNPVASRKMVERFRRDLREKFGQELYWE